MATQTQNRGDQSMQRTGGQQGGNAQDAMQPFDDAYKYFQEYARARPEVVALWCFGIGFVLGWKLKPW